VGVSVAPIIPALNDHEIPAILQAAAEAGACFASYTVVRLPFSVKEVFSDWLDAHFPERKEKILGRIRETQGPTLSHGEFGKRLKGEGIWAEQIAQIFKVSMLRSGLAQRAWKKLSVAAFRRPMETGGQMTLEL